MIKKGNYLDAIIILLLLLISGSPFMRYNNIYLYILMPTVLIALSIKNIKLYKTDIIYFLAIMIVLIAPNLFIYHDDNTKNITMLWIKIVFVTIYMRNVATIVFIKLYIDILYTLSLLSLIVYAMLLIMPGLQSNLPTYITETGVSYKNAGVLVYHTAIGEVYRNYSIFWEPGAYAVFLLIAHILTLQSHYNLSDKKFIVLFIAGISSMSTLYLIFIPIIVIMRVKTTSKYDRPLVVFALLSVILAVLVNLLPLLTQREFDFAQKFNETNYSLVGRKVSFIENLNISTDSKLMGFGYKGFSQEIDERTNGFIGGSFNSFPYITAVYGIFFTILLFYRYYRGLKNITQNRLAFFVGFSILMGTFISQSLILSPILLGISSLNKLKYKSTSK